MADTPPVVWLTCVRGPSDGVRLPIRSTETEVHIRADVQSYPIVVPEAERVTTRSVLYRRDGDFLYAQES